MANRISNRASLSQYNGAWTSPPVRAVIVPPIVYTAITTPAAQPVSTSNVNVRTATVTAFVGQFPSAA